VALDVGTSRGDQVLAPNFEFYKGVNISFISFEREALILASTKELMGDWLELKHVL